MSGRNRTLTLAISAVLGVLAGVPAFSATSTASKNREGNRLFAQGRYNDAEKAYLDAQIQDPGRPELLYNLGNSLIKQNKYDRALRSLRQATSAGSKELQENGWYNAGNALFSMGNFKDSAQAFIQALRINPADRDAKHNLELALQKLKQQSKMGSSGSPSENPQKSDGSEQGQQPAANQSRQQPTEASQQNSPVQPEQGKPANPQATRSDLREGSFTKERALQILDALQNQELAEQRKLLERRARRNAEGRDW